MKITDALDELERFAARKIESVLHSRNSNVSYHDTRNYLLTMIAEARTELKQLKQLKNAEIGAPIEREYEPEAECYCAATRAPCGYCTDPKNFQDNEDRPTRKNHE